MRHKLTVLVALAICSRLFAATPTPAEEGMAEEPFKTNERGLDRRNMDLTADACTDFYQYANGNWLTRNPVPEEQSTWGMSSELRERNYELLRTILEESAAADAEPGTNKRKAGDFWRTAMDTEKLESAGVEPLAADLERIAKVESPADVQAFIDDFHVQGTSLLFDRSEEHTSELQSR